MDKLIPQIKIETEEPRLEKLRWRRRVGRGGGGGGGGGREESIFAANHLRAHTEEFALAENSSCISLRLHSKSQKRFVRVNI